MPSPFPGMDPWLEDTDIFPDLHQRLAVAAATSLAPRLHPRYFARVCRRIVTDILEPGSVAIALPDVAVVWPGGRRHEGDGFVAVADAPPTPAVDVALPVPVPVPQLRVEVRVAHKGQLVTAIEIVSLANKRPGSADARAFRRKRERYRAAGVHCVEIDLLRLFERDWPPEAPSAAYRVLLYRAGALHASVWPIGVRDRLPNVPIPLRAPDPDVTLDLQATFGSAVDQAGYDLEVDYRSPPPPPPLGTTDLRWLRGLRRRSR